MQAIFRNMYFIYIYLISDDGMGFVSKSINAAENIKIAIVHLQAANIYNQTTVLHTYINASYDDGYS